MVALVSLRLRLSFPHVRTRQGFDRFVATVRVVLHDFSLPRVVFRQCHVRNRHLFQKQVQVRHGKRHALMCREIGVQVTQHDFLHAETPLGRYAMVRAEQQRSRLVHSAVDRHVVCVGPHHQAVHCLRVLRRH